MRACWTSFLFVLVVFVGSALCFGGSDNNLARNPGFEQIDTRTGLPSGWSTRPGEREVKVLSEGARTGEHAVRFIDRDKTKGIMLECKRLPARPSGTYTASAWFRTQAPCRPGVYINFYDDTGARVDAAYRRLDAPSKEWTKVTVTAVAPVNAYEVAMCVYSYVGDVGVFDVDDVSLTVKGGKAPGTGLVTRAKPGGKKVVDVGSNLELFVDDYLVDSFSGEACRLLHHPQPRNVVLRFGDKPWEGRFAGYVTVMNDGGKVRLYYRGWNDLKKEAVTCVAESADGVHFTRPELGIFEFDGSKKNNIVWAGPGTHNFAPFKDGAPNVPADQRYKALASAGPHSSLVPFASPDGYHWKMLQKEPVITEGAFDSQNLAFWDALRKEYVCYLRDFRNGVRDIRRATSKDFIHWTTPEWLDYGDAPPEHLYTNAVSPYYRAPHIYLGFPCRFVPARKKIPQHGDMGINDGVIMCSRDGLHWQRWVEAFLRPGPDWGDWTDRNNYIAWGMAQTSDTDLSLYWNEFYRYPEHHLRRGTIRIDGFVSIHAGASGGEMLTRPMVFSGKRLIINYATSAIGSVRLELCDEAGNAYEGFAMGEFEPLFGNEIAHEVSWRSGQSVATLAGKPVRLRVRLKDADLYSIQFKD